MARQITFDQFSQFIDWNTYYAMVVDTTSSRYMYCGGEMCDEVWNTLSEAESIWIEPMAEAEEAAVATMRINMLAELEPANGAEDENFAELKRILYANEGEVITVNVNDDLTYYILLLD